MKKIIFFILCLNSILLAEKNELQKAFNHILITDTADQFSHIEFGKIVFYFSHEPVVKKTASIPSKGFQEVNFFIPHASINSQQAKAMIQQLNTSRQPYYSLQVLTLQNPTPGIEIKITYNPSKIIVDYDFFEAITKAKGLEFHLYNKPLLEALKKKKQPILQVAQLKPTVIIDCGHGGSDTGTTGFFNTIEKEITLKIGMKLANFLEKKGMRVILTRTDDTFVSLDQRTLLANKCSKNSILLSLHANNSPKKEVHGIETFHVSRDLYKKEKELATAIDVMVEKYNCLQYENSKKLAGAIHSTICAHAKAKGFYVPDRRIRHAATQVLMGIKWPGILLELDYLSNEHGASLLQNSAYHDVLIQSIAQGITDYYLHV